MSSPRLIACKVCKTVKERLEDGINAIGTKRWVDALGRQFNGRTCPECHVAKVKDKMAMLRSQRRGSSTDSY